MDLFHPLEPTDPSLLPLADQQASAQLDLEASREASKTPTIAYPEQSHDPVRLDKRNLLFLYILQIHRKPRLAVHLLHRLSSTRTLPRHMVEFIQLRQP